MYDPLDDDDDFPQPMLERQMESLIAAQTETNRILLRIESWIKWTVGAAAFIAVAQFF